MVPTLEASLVHLHAAGQDLDGQCFVGQHFDGQQQGPE